MTNDATQELFLKLADDADRFERDAVTPENARYFEGLASGMRLAADMLDLNKGEEE